MANIPISAFRENLATHLDKVTDNREPLVVTRSGGKDNVVVMAEDEFRGWQETVHLLSSPANAKRLMSSVRQIKNGRARERELTTPGKGV